MLSIVAVEIPGPLSVTTISPVSVETSIATTGAMPISSAMSIELSASSFTTTSPHSCGS
jgi:hypothetical protein